jgi:transketolase
MINQSQKLNPKVFDADVDKQPIRKGFGEGLLEAGQKDERVVALCADLTESTQMDKFAKAFPLRYVEIGVAEQNLATVASGMAAMGKLPFCSSYAMFSPGRNWEQIRTTIAYNDVPVVIVGSHAGISVGPDGGTHQAIEDIALMRVMPNMTVVSPCDAIEAKKATLALAVQAKPAYLRLARDKTPIITTDQTPFVLGKGTTLWDSPAKAAESGSVGKTVGIIATGALVHKALLAAKKLSEEGVGVIVLNIHTIKPLDDEAVVALASHEGLAGIVTVEEHQIAGGLGGAVAELLSSRKPTRIEFIGVHDQFGQSGTPDELVAHYKMDEKAIEEAAKRLLA